MYRECEVYGGMYREIPANGGIVVLFDHLKRRLYNVLSINDVWD